MKIHNLIQGSPEWLAYRAQHYNASDAPAMMGISPYKTRTELLHELHTGLTPDIDQAMQRLFDDGHRFEALARPLAEEIIGQELYPVVGSDGELSASFDGLTMDESINFEHKSLNSELLAVLDAVDWRNDAEPGRALPLLYRVQMEQQHMVSGCEKTLFMASKWQGEDLIEERHCWYESDLELRAQIISGWKQFAIDLAAYVPTATEVKPAGRAPETLPALHIEVTGMVTASNLAEYKAHALAVFGSINRELVTDQDFASAESTVKWCADIESRLAAAKQHALSQTESIDALFRTIDDISAEARATRLELDKLVKVRKDSIRSDIVTDGRNALAEHIHALETRIGRALMPIVPADFPAAIKGKHTLNSIKNAVATELARAKIAANEIADRITVNLRMIDAHNEHAFLFADTSTLALKDPEFVAMAVKNRIAKHKAAQLARIEAERERIAQEERIKAETAAQARADEEIAAALAQAQADDAAQRASADAIAKAKTAPPVLEQQAINANSAPHDPASPPTLRLGQISERLSPIQITADGLRQLGFEPAATDKTAKLYFESDFPRICAALVRHINGVCELQTA